MSARVSHGPRPYILAIQALQAAGARRDGVMRRLCASALALGVLAASPCAGQESLGDAWWTGFLQAAGAATLPAGHMLFEPYVYDVIAAHSQTFTSRTYLIYGLIDRVSVGVIPIVAYSSSIGFEDLTAQAQYRLTQFHVGKLGADDVGSHPGDVSDRKIRPAR